MIDIALYEPEIPPNTGNIIRLCANLGCGLHLIGPLGFAIEDKRLRRAGLDYHEWARIQQHSDYAAFKQWAGQRRVIGLSTKAQQVAYDVGFQMDDILLFGPESRGLPQAILEDLQPDCLLRIPMLAESRSLNLSNAVAIVAYEAFRQIGLPNLV